MSGLTDALDGAMADVAPNAGHHRYRDAAIDQDGALLDVQFQPRRD